MRKLPRERGHRLFESLESRRLMSAAVSTGYQDATQAIQNAINGAAPGQTVQLSAGTYKVSSALNLDGRTLAGVAGQTTLQWTGGSGGYAIHTGSNSELEGVTVNGAGVQISDDSNNVTLTNDTIENTGGTGIDCEGGSNKLQITDDTVQNIGGYGMVLYSINQANVDDNTINNVYEGIHAVNFDGDSAGNACTFNYNTVTGITRHGIEIQNNWNNLSVGWNYLADFNVQPGENSHIALSIATGPGADGAIAQNVDVHDNVILGTGPGVPSNPNCDFTAIEIMGNGSIVNHNYIANWGWGVLDGLDSNLQVTNNDFVGVTSQNGDAVPENGGVSPSVDSGNTWSGNWDGKVPSAFAISAPSNSSSSSSSAATTAATTTTTSASTSSPSTSSTVSTSANGWSLTATAPAQKATTSSTVTPSTTAPAPAAPAPVAPAPATPTKNSSGSNSSSSGRQTVLGVR